MSAAGILMGHIPVVSPRTRQEAFPAGRAFDHQAQLRTVAHRRSQPVAALHAASGAAHASSVLQAPVETRQTSGRHASTCKPFEPVSGPHVWYRSDYQDVESYSYTLSPADIQELASAVAEVQRQGIELKNVKQSDFKLPVLGPKLIEFRDEAVNGRGFVLLRGLPVNEWPVEEVAIAYWGLGTYWGKAQPQNRLHHLLGHVKDVNPPGGFENPVNRVYATHGAQPYHTDSSDLVALLCLKPAKVGGYSTWASSYSIYNALLQTQPELVEALAEEWYLDRKDEIPEGEGPWFKLPVFSWYKGNLISYFENSFIRTAPRHEDVPELTDLQKRALQAVEDLADSIELRMDYVLQPGDIQLLHNHSIVHARTAYVDHDDEPTAKRHLMRLWLAPENDWELPEGFGARWNGVKVGDRGGIYIPNTVPRAPLDAEMWEVAEEKSKA
ncbi:hypothetical protein ABBQ32_010091 [Trebouxia sp. C0010 RCD-2024]